jgi:hypothetical protein
MTMILRQDFKTLAGAQKRCAFENAHKTRGNLNMIYSVHRFLDGKLDLAPLDRSLSDRGRYTWRICKASVRLVLQGRGFMSGGGSFQAYSAY